MGDTNDLPKMVHRELPDCTNLKDVSVGRYLGVGNQIVASKAKDKPTKAIKYICNLRRPGDNSEIVKRIELFISKLSKMQKNDIDKIKENCSLPELPGEYEDSSD